MAVLDLSVNIADADKARLFVAARAAFGDPNLTDAEVVEHLRQYGIDMMRQVVRNYEKGLAVAQAEALEPTIEVS